MRLEREPLTLRSSPDTAQPGPKHPFGTHMQGRSARQESALLLLRKFGNLLKVHLYADVERFLDCLEGFAVNGDIEIGADRLPILAAAVGIAPRSKVHAVSPLDWPSGVWAGCKLYHQRFQLPASRIPFQSRRFNLFEEDSCRTV